MIESDTIKLLRECDSGIKMGISAIEDVVHDVDDSNLQKLLIDCKVEHENLRNEINGMLDEYHDNGKDPNFMAKTMSHMKTKTKMAMKRSDKTVSDLMTDGCNMGVKSLNRYLNQYEAASERTKDITKRLINLEEKLAVDMRSYL